MSFCVTFGFVAPAVSDDHDVDRSDTYDRVAGRAEMTFAKHVEGMRLYYRSTTTEKDTRSPYSARRQRLAGGHTNLVKFTGHCCVRLRCSKSAKSGGRRLIRSPHGTPGVTESTAITSRPGRTRRLICPTGCRTIFLSSPHSKNIPLHHLVETALWIRPSRPTEGRFAIVTNVGQGCDGRGSALDERCS